MSYYPLYGPDGFIRIVDASEAPRPLQPGERLTTGPRFPTKAQLRHEAFKARAWAEHCEALERELSPDTPNLDAHLAKLHALAQRHNAEDKLTRSHGKKSVTD